MAQIPPKQVEGTRIIIFKNFGPKKVEKINIVHGGGVFAQFWLYDLMVQSTWDGTSEIKIFCQNPLYHIQKSIFSPKKLTTVFKKTRPKSTKGDMLDV